MITNPEKRREIAAMQIAAAMERKGLSRSQLADAMGRSRSEVTKWLGGRHNFTNDLLAELSMVLGEEITGVGTSGFVSGYSQRSDDSVLQDSAFGILSLDLKSYAQAESNARRNGLDIVTYVKSLISKDTRANVTLPKVDFNQIPGRLARKYSGCLDADLPESCLEDERFERIWNR